MAEEEKNQVTPVNIHDEVKSSFLDYAMSVIVSRALPDVKDGLKPVHRRILYAMSDMGLTPDKPHRKSARVVGEVLGKYHPHGDLSVYDALVRLAQDYASRYPLVDGHGNFGSVDGDSAAAMRYTEARMASIAAEMLTNIKKETVDFRPNFDESLQEPVVLPSRFPNILVNGSSGIAVGMATNIPPHNLNEVIDAINYFIDKPDAEINELMQFIKGPDFPTGALIVGREGINNAYQNGKGIIKIQGKVEVESSAKKKDVIVIKEIPYMQNKAKLVEKIADLIKEKKIEGISDLRDESNRFGIRVVMEIRSGFNPHLIINQLYKFTPLQQSYGINLLALVDGEPRVLNLKEILYHYLEHQKDVIIRRTKFDLRKAEDRLHVVEGLMVALSNLDEVIKIIRGSEDVPTARQSLMQRFDLTEVQAQAILDMRLQKLTGLEREKLEEEHESLQKDIAYYKRLLEDEAMLMSVIKAELEEIKTKHGDKRRTQITEDSEEIDEMALIREEEVVLTLTQKGYIKRMPLDNYKSQRRGGKGIIGAKTRENDYIKAMHICSTHSNLLCFTNKGRVYQIKTHEIPEAKRQSRGTAMINLLPFQENEHITRLVPIRDFDKNQYLLMITARGYIKKTPLKAFNNARKSGIIALSMNEGDELVSVLMTEGGEEIVIGSDTGHFIRFKQDDVRSMGRNARGVKAIRLESNATLIGADCIQDDKYILLITSKGYGKRVSLDELGSQRRGGKGVLAIKTDHKSGKLSSFKVIKGDEEFMIGTSKGIILRQKAKEVSIQRRYSRGVTLIKVGEDDYVRILTDID